MNNQRGNQLSTLRNFFNRTQSLDEAIQSNIEKQSHIDEEKDKIKFQDHLSIVTIVRLQQFEKFLHGDFYKFLSRIENIPYRDIKRKLEILILSRIPLWKQSLEKNVHPDSIPQEVYDLLHIVSDLPHFVLEDEGRNRIIDFINDLESLSNMMDNSDPEVLIELLNDLLDEFYKFFQEQGRNYNQTMRNFLLEIEKELESLLKDLITGRYNSDIELNENLYPESPRHLEPFNRTKEILKFVNNSRVRYTEIFSFDPKNFRRFYDLLEERIRIFREDSQELIQAISRDKNNLKSIESRKLQPFKDMQTIDLSETIL